MQVICFTAGDVRRKEEGLEANMFGVCEQICLSFSNLEPGVRKHETSWNILEHPGTLGRQIGFAVSHM